MNKLNIDLHNKYVVDDFGDVWRVYGGFGASRDTMAVYSPPSVSETEPNTTSVMTLCDSPQTTKSERLKRNAPPC